MRNDWPHHVGGVILKKLKQLFQTFIFKVSIKVNMKILYAYIIQIINILCYKEIGPLVFEEFHGQHIIIVTHIWMMEYKDCIIRNISSARRHKDLTGYCFKYIDRPFCLRTDDIL